MSKVAILTPVGRLVMGSLYKPSTKDADGNPLVFKTGANAGQARANYFLALAVPKGTESHWSQTEWGKIIYAIGAAEFPQAHKSPAFAWKVTDGDDATPNSRGKANRDNEGFAGNWILRFSGSFAPKVYREEGGAYVQVTEQDYIKPGYWVRISGSIAGNGSQQRPGLYLNHDMVAFSGYGQEIFFGKDANEVFAAPAALPAGASAVPLASSVPLPVGNTSTSTNAPTSQSRTGNVSNVQPNTAFLNVPPPPAAPAGPKMTAKANGVTREAFLAANWTDEMLIAQGMMTA